MDLRIGSEALFLGRRIKAGQLVISPMLVNFNGDFIVIRTDTSAGDLSRDSWSSTHEMIYLSPADLEEFLL